jgi:glycosyltransferase involved in cell wall biosynthesis
VAHGETGLVISAEHLTEMADALVGLARDPARAEAFGQAGRVRQRREFSTGAMIHGYAALLEAVGR